MWILVLLLSLFFILIPFSVNKSNAKYILAGYNTMSAVDQKKFDLDGYLTFFKKYFIMLGIGMFIGFTIANLIFGEAYAFIVFITILFISLPFFILRSKKFQHHSIIKKYNTLANWGAGIIGILFFSIIFFFYLGLEDNEINLEDHALEIKGMYGEEVDYASIKYIEIADALPQIKLRTNGMGLGSYLKGYFRTNEGKSVKLLVHTDHPPFLKIEADNKTIYWNTKDADIPGVYNQLLNKIN